MLREFDAQLQKGDNPGAWTCVVMRHVAERGIEANLAMQVSRVSIPRPVGVGPAIANAVYHATGVRVRELPIRPEALLAGRERLMRIDLTDRVVAITTGVPQQLADDWSLTVSHHKPA
jgi:hypothetical protein